MPIEGNEDIINDITKDFRRGISRSTFIPVRGAKSTISIIERIRRGSGGSNRGYTPSEGFRGRDGRDDSIYLGQQSDATGNIVEAGGNNEALADGTQGPTEGVRFRSDEEAVGAGANP